LLYIFATCPYLLETLPSLAIDKRKPEDADTTGADHACLTGDTKVVTKYGVVPIKDLDGVKTYVLSHDGQYHLAFGSITNKRATIMRLEFEDGSFVECTPDHKFMLADGTFKEAQNFKIGTKIKCIDEKQSDLQIVALSLNRELKEVYCLNVPDTSTFVLANSIVSHNCDALRYLCKARLIDAKWVQTENTRKPGVIVLADYVNKIRRKQKQARI
jgi:hypothetical protein